MLVLLDTWVVERPCGGTVELFRNEEDLALPYRLRYTTPTGEGYAVAMMREDTARFVAKNWARGQTDVPWSHLGDGNVWMD